MALFIAFYAGAITVFHHELHHWDGYTPASQEEQSLDDAQQLLDLAIARDPAAADFFRLELASDDDPQHTGRWFERLESGEFERHEYRLTAAGALDTGEDTAHVSNFVYRLHYTAGLPNRLGLYTLGVICVIYGLALVSGILLFFPNFLKDLFVVRSGSRNKKRFWLDAHNVVGVISLPWHVVFAWSSAVLAIGIFFLAPFQFLVFDDDLIETVGPELGVVSRAEASGVAQPPLSITELLLAAETALPGFDPIQLRFDQLGDENGQVTIFGTLDSKTLVSNGSITMALTTAEVLNVFDPRDATPGGTFYRGLIVLHFVEFGGELTKWVYFVLSMGGAFLFFSGNILYVETRRKRRQQAQPSRTVFMARLNSGVCIGCMAGISAAFLATRGFAEFSNRADLTEWTYYALFFAAIAWAFCRPVAAGTRELLQTCGVLTALIPVADWLFVGMTPWRSVAAGEWSFLVIDLLAMVFAIVFFTLAGAIHRRSIHGDPNSVWAQQSRADQRVGETAVEGAPAPALIATAD